ncbi:MAG: DUF1476 domain-containing protein [Alphaproteobacteria bacterium]|nr:DUF1476 domain-containing protein [Alphaproteobacteria bacterium]
MSGFDERESAFENKFALDETLMFKAEARCCKLFGLWLAEKIGLSEEEAGAYAASIVSANLEEPGFDDVKRAVMPDIKEKNLDISEEEIDAKLAKFFEIAQGQVKQESAA